jgi:thiol-disulfide isomerase/thioredoxin
MAHDLGRPAGEAATPQRVRRCGRRFGFLRPAHPVAAALVLGLAAAGAAGAMPRFLSPQQKIGVFTPTTPPLPAPALSFTDLKGNLVGLAFFKGEPVVLNLWATWCGPCKQEMPSLDRLQSDFAGRLAVVAISEDMSGAKAVAPFLATLKLAALKPYLDPKSMVAQAFGVEGLPTSILIDGSGRVVGTIEGKAEWGSARLRAALQPLLAGRGAVKSSLR